MKRIRRVVWAIAMTGTMVTGCNRETGPSLAFVVENEALAPSSTLPNASAQCCCRVRGKVQNTSTIPLHVTLNFQGRDARGTSLGTAIDFVSNLPPGGRASFDAPGILAPCSAVASLRRQHLVTGVFTGDGS